MTNDSGKCEAGCSYFDGGEKCHDKNCVYYPESRTKMYDDALEEIQRLQKQLAMCKEALKYYRGSDDDETSWMEPDQYVPYWTLWHDGDCVGGKVAAECLAKLDGAE